MILTEPGAATRAFTPGQTAQLLIKSEPARFQVFVNGVKFCAFRHRIRPENVTAVRVSRIVGWWLLGWLGYLLWSGVVEGGLTVGILSR